MSATQMATAPAAIDNLDSKGEIKSQEAAAPPNPFVGLVPLNEQNASLLAGRDEEVRILTTNLRAARLTLVYGASGVGKSSLLRAGVVAKLRELANEELNSFGAPSFAVAVISNWAGDPFEQVRIGIREGLIAALQVESIPPLPPSTNLVETIRACNQSCGVELFFVLDQFEEFFLYHEKQSGQGTFAYEFPRAVNTTDIKARFLLSLRDDSLYKLDRFQRTLPALFENRLQVEPLTAANAEQAIEKARIAYNDSPAAITQVTIEPGLIDAVLDQVRTDNMSRDINTPVLTQWALNPNASNAGYIDAPYMQLVMSRLWEEESKRWEKEKKPENTLRLDALKTLGTAQNVVQQHLDKIMKTFSSRERKIASDCFSSLVTPGGSKYALTPGELQEWTGYKDEEIKVFLEKLADSKYRVVRRVNKKTDKGTEVAYEAHHDRLALAMRSWHIKHSTTVAERKRLIFSFLIFGAVLVFLAGVVFYVRHKEKQEAAAQGKQLQQQYLEEAQKGAKLGEEYREVAKDLNIEATAVNKDRTKLAALRTLVPKLTCKDVSGSGEIKEINSILEIECAPTNDTQQTPRIYLHIQSENQRATANDLKEWLRTQEFDNRRVIVPGIENVGRRTLKESQVRYFQNEEYWADFAWLIVSSLRKQCVAVAPPLLIGGYEDSNLIRPGHFELWLTEDALSNFRCVNNAQAR